jgi:hypothetical protein
VASPRSCERCGLSESGPLGLLRALPDLGKVKLRCCTRCRPAEAQGPGAIRRASFAAAQASLSVVVQPRSPRISQRSRRTVAVVKEGLEARLAVGRAHSRNALACPVSASARAPPSSRACPSTQASKFLSAGLTPTCRRRNRRSERERYAPLSSYVCAFTCANRTPQPNLARTAGLQNTHPTFACDRPPIATRILNPLATLYLHTVQIYAEEQQHVVSISSCLLQVWQCGPLRRGVLVVREALL